MIILIEYILVIKKYVQKKYFVKNNYNKKVNQTPREYRRKLVITYQRIFSLVIIGYKKLHAHFENFNMQMQY